MGRSRPHRPLTVVSSFFLFNFFCLTSSFNIDVRNPVIHHHTSPWFGYSMDFYQHEGMNLLIVGAPKGHQRQHGVTNQGVVFRCSTDKDGTCIALELDKKGNEKRLNGSIEVPIEEKSNQMLGASVVASKRGDSILACAPHYKYFFSKFDLIEPVGACFYARSNFQNITEYAPCRQEPAQHGYHRLGYGMCGFSAAVPDNGDKRLFIGAPGAYYWQGSIFSQSLTAKGYPPNTPFGPPRDDHNTLGYSIAVGDFDGDGTDDFVAGAPRANELIGAIYIYNWKLGSLRNLTDKNGQRGQYFGAAVAVTDLNGDGLDDIIVGSPLYTDYQSVKDVKTQEMKPRYDVGKVMIFLQGPKHDFPKWETLIGHTEWSRFGFSIAAAGDLNRDGYNDFIVGAPYGGEDGNGAVYVYHGAKDGVRKEPTQKIEAKQIKDRYTVKTFGFSLAAGKDIDANQYPDIAVGAYRSSHAVVFKTKPVVTVIGSLKLEKQSINLEEKGCTVRIADKVHAVSCTKMEICMQYSGKGDPPRDMDLKLLIQLDSKQTIEPRAFFAGSDLDGKRGVRAGKRSHASGPHVIEQTVHMRRGQKFCDNYYVYVPDTIRDKLSPIHITANYTYEERRTTDALEPALDTTVPLSFVSELAIDKNCGPDEKCIPDLKVHAISSKEKFTIGAKDQSLTVNVTVKNSGESSYESQFFITVPPGFEYDGIENYDTKRPIACSTKGKGGKDEDYIFACDIGNPLPENAEADFGFRLKGTAVDPSQEEVILHMTVNSSNEEAPGHEADNNITLRIPIEIEAQLSLAGISIPDQVDYSIRNRTLDEDATFDSDIGPVIMHRYEVLNRGPSTVNSASLDIIWPSFADNNKDLLYLIDVPQVTVDASRFTKAKCRVKQNQNVNPRSLVITNSHLEKKAPVVKNPSVSPTSGVREKERVRSRFSDNSRRRAKARKTRDLSPTDELRIRAMKKNEMKSAVKLAKAAGSAVEYKGPLSRGTIDCNNNNCTHIECDIEGLNADERVVVDIFARLVLNTLIDNNIFEADISSIGIAKISSLPYAPQFNPPAQLLVVTTDVNPTDPEQAQRGVPWWLYLLAVLIGLLILLLLILCLWRCGFFKRNRPPTEQATYNKGTRNSEMYADSQVRYAHPHMYNEEKHGVRV